MKTIVLGVIGVMLFGTTVYAEMASPKPTTLPGGKIVKPLIERTQGKIDVIKKTDALKSELGGFSIIDADGKKKNFDLIAKTHFFSSNSSPINFADLKKGDQVIVLSVVTLKGLNEAISVSQTK